MSGQLGKDVPPETAQAWDSARRVREPIAWALLVIAAIAVLVSAWQLLGLPGDGLPGGPVASAVSSAPVTSGPGPGPGASGPGPAPITGPSPVAVTTLRLAGIGCGAAICGIGSVAHRRKERWEDRQPPCFTCSR
jgi:hypothetical protein